MLEYLFLHVGGYFGGDELYLVRNQGGVLEADALYASERSDLDYRRHSIRRTLTMSPEQSKQWLQKLEQIHFDYWEESYYACGVCDGTQWSLTYKYSGKEREKCGGSNAYPENWSSSPSSLSLSVPLYLPVCFII